jgi:catechol 2,3-dioxygenase-like lactoylglutathione lyase family enzyme
MVAAHLASTERSVTPNRSVDKQSTEAVMLGLRKVAPRLPAQDLDRARRWYADVLGLTPAEERSGGLRYQVGGSEFVLFQSAGCSDGSFTQMAFEVADLRATVAALAASGVTFERYEKGSLRTNAAGIATIDGNYPSRGGTGEYGAWFRDCEGNLLGIGQPF